ncbi:MAG: NAD-dependent dehydratase, partial [Cyclobacteriaceae bacterium]
GQVWHLPTADDPPTGKEWVEMCAHLLNTKPKARNTPRFILNVMGLFSPIMKELGEMNYQYETDYVFNSTKFQQKFDMNPTPYKDSILLTIQNDYPDRFSGN